MRKIFYTSSLALLLIVTGCKNSQVIKCPDVSAAGSHHTIWARAPHSRSVNVAAARTEPNKVVAPKPKEEAVASASDQVQPYQLKLPRFAASKMNDDEVKDVNSIFAKYSGNKVQLERNAHGRTYLKANSANDIFKLATTLAAVKKIKPRSTAPRRCRPHCPCRWCYRYCCHCTCTGAFCKLRRISAGLNSHYIRRYWFVFEQAGLGNYWYCIGCAGHIACRCLRCRSICFRAAHLRIKINGVNNLPRLSSLTKNL
jgi:hypothetical protein